MHTIYNRPKYISWSRHNTSIGYSLGIYYYVSIAKKAFDGKRKMLSNELAEVKKKGGRQFFHFFCPKNYMTIYFGFSFV